MTRRESYQHNILVYKKRRIEAKKKYELHRKVYRNLTQRISQWQNEIKRIDARHEKLNKIFKAVNKYFHVNIAERCVKPETNLARNIYYKIGMESKIHGRFVSDYIGRSKRTAGECRLRFTRSFKTKPQNADKFHRFKDYLEMRGIGDG